MTAVLEYSSGPTKLCSGCGRFMPIDDNRRLLPHNKGLYLDTPCIDKTETNTMTAEEFAQEAIKGILSDPAGDTLLRHFDKPWRWVTSYVSLVSAEESLKAATLLMEWKILKPDNRKHSGLGPNRGDRYRISRGWWNRNHKVE